MSLTNTRSTLPPDSYGALLREIKERIRAAQYAALRAVNRELINLYWDIGRLIVERQSGETWGRSVVQNLAMDLQLEFPGVAGFSAPNLYKMRHFYEAYHGHEILSPLVREISWTKNLCQGKVEMSPRWQSRNVPFCLELLGARDILRSPVKRRRAMLASNPIKE